MVTISFLADTPQHLPTVASWIFDEWDHLIPGFTLAKLEAKLQAYLSRDTIPLALVALSDGLPVGTASMQPEDMSSRPDLSPWLAAVYVLPDYRNKGIGAQLVKGVENVAHSLQISKLYLFTPDQEKFYARLGWSVMETTEYHNQQVVIMDKTFTKLDLQK
jgi:N-acetylglutamate synthase-like GNAT family acetyltransferase